METQARERFNNSFSTEKYQSLLEEVKSEFPNQLDFRIAESPVFIDKELKTKLLLVSNSIIDNILKPDFIKKTEKAIPEEYKAPNGSNLPEVLAIDYAVTKNSEGSLEPKLIELQGFPSLFAYQHYLGEKYSKFFDIDLNSFSPYLNRLNNTTYLHEMEQFLLNGHKSEEVILLEIYPEKQKTKLDFALTEHYWGIKAICLTKIVKEGKKLFYQDKNGKKVQIKRIYNRLIVDELQKNYPELKTDFTFKDDVEVEWVNHPNWYFRISKFCLPLLNHDFIPKSFYLSDIKEIPDNLENYVLKPLFSFAGSGVKINLTPADIKDIKEPENYLLQEKVNYEPVVKDTNGNFIKTEIRLLYILPNGKNRPKLMTNLCRLSRGEMIGVNFNKDFDWVGGSAGFFEQN